MAASRWSTVMVGLGALILTSCGVNSVEVAAGPGERPSECRDAQGIATLLASGTPLFDYEPAPDVASLVEQTDVVITGTLDSVVRIESPDLNASSGSGFLTEFRIGDSIGYRELAQDVDESLETERRFYIGSDWSGGDDPLAEPVLFDEGRTRFVAFLTSTGNPSAPWLVGPQGLHVWCSFDDEVQSVIDSVPLNSTIAPDDFERAIINVVVDPPPVFDFVDVAARVLLDDISAGVPSTARVIESFDDLTALATSADLDFEADPENEVFFEFVAAESGSCPLGPFETLRFDRNSRVLIPVFAQVDSDSDCTLDANPHLLVVAVARQDLPANEFGIATSGFPNGVEPTQFRLVE